jgi:hypothetical protein
MGTCPLDKLRKFGANLPCGSWRFEKEIQKRLIMQQVNNLNNSSHASALARGNVVWAVLPSYGKG